MKIKAIFVLVTIIALSGCIEPEEPNFFNGIETVSIPEYCFEYKKDVCGLFDCMVDSCWCKEGSDQILMEGRTIVANEEDALNVVKNFIFAPDATLPEGIVIENAVKINSVFYNVFVNNSFGEEDVYTIAVDGTIIQTVCGV